MNPPDLQQITIVEASDIFQAELEILSAEIENDFVKITCLQANTGFKYSGGTLLLSCKAIKILDQDRRELTINEFDQICKEYWEECSKKLEQDIIKRST